MSTTRVFIMPLGTQEWIDVSRDVKFDTLGSLTYKVESSDYDVGIFKFSSTNISLRNEDGLYSEEGAPRTIFVNRRNGSNIKITWEIEQEDNPLCGIAYAGNAYASDEVILFYGTLSDEATTQDLIGNDTTFSILSLDSRFGKIEADYAAINASVKTLGVIMEILLPQAGLTIFSISLAENYVLDDVSDFENKTVYEVLRRCLVLSNSVLTIREDFVTVSPRVPTAILRYTFYGQAATDGIENIINISKIKSGLSRTFNLVTWAETTLSARSTTSIDDYGVKIKELDFKEVTNNTNRQKTINSIFNEFSLPKMELTLDTFLNYDTVDLSLLDKINIDYPTISYPPQGEILPLYGFAKYGQAKYPFSEWGLVLLPSTEFKILEKKINLSNQTITFLMREI